MTESTEQPSPQPAPDASFLTIVYTMATQAMIALGEIDNPITKQRSVDPRQAKWHVDSLEILKAKTEGNLEEAEAKALESILAQIRMVYVKKV